MIPSWLRISRRASLYRSVFDTPEGRVVLADLKDFCRLERSTLVTNPITRQSDQVATNHAEGRREVLLRIMKLTSISYDDILRIKAEEELAIGADQDV